MSKISLFQTIQKVIIVPVASFIFIFGALFVSLTPNTHAQSISLEPISIDRSNPDERGWFLYNVKPGQIIDDTLVVRNASAFDTKVELNANDATVTTDGTFSLSSNEAAKTQLGSWITMSQKTLAVKSGENIGVPFQIKVPADAKSGEYAGGLSAIIIDDNEASGGIGAKLRMGVRMYLTVSGDLKMNPSITKMQIANPQSPDFEDRLRSRGSVTPENMGFYLTAQELGNVYTKSVNNVIFALPDGKTEKRTFTRNYIPGQPATEFYLETNIPYQVGLTKVTLDYQAAPFIDNKSDLNKSNTSGSLTYDMNLSQSDYDKLVTSYDQIKKEGDNRRGKPIIKSTPKTTALTIGEGENKPQEVIKDSSNSTVTIIVFVLVGIIAGLILAMIFILFKNTKAKKNAELLPVKNTPVNSNPQSASDAASPVSIEEVKK